MTISRDQLLDLARRAGFSPTVWQLDLLEAMYRVRADATTADDDVPSAGVPTARETPRYATEHLRVADDGGVKHVRDDAGSPRWILSGWVDEWKHAVDLDLMRTVFTKSDEPTGATCFGHPVVVHEVVPDGCVYVNNVDVLVPDPPPLRPVPTWDTIAPGEAVLVRFDGEVMAAVVDCERDLAVGLEYLPYLCGPDDSVEFLAWLTPDRKV